MSKREINEMLNQSLTNLNLLIDSSKVVGKPVQIDESRLLIPLSKLTFGFGVGGSEFKTENGNIINNNLIEEDTGYPFGGGTLGGVNVTPIAFLLIDNNTMEILRVEQGETLFDKLIDLAVAVLKKSNKNIDNV